MTEQAAPGLQRAITQPPHPQTYTTRPTPVRIPGPLPPTQHTHTQVLDFKKWKAILGFQSNIKDSSMPVLHPLPRQCTKFTPWTPQNIHDPFLYIHFHRPPPPVTPMPVMSAGWKCTWKARTPAFLGRPLLMEGPFTGGPRWVQWALL